jgi:polyphosphate kinase 2 (PPK2 family)
MLCCAGIRRPEVLVLDTVDLSQSLSRERYRRAFPPLQERLRQLQYELKEAQIPSLVVFEGWDAAGKSTVIQRLTERLDPRGFRHIPGAPPSELEQRYHFLWRYQVKLPEDGQVAFFDHSWYGRVLVERVEKLTPKKQWRLAYEEINDFERWLADDGQLIVKFFLHLSKAEQKRRLRRMERDEVEHWKVQKEDWRRNRRYDDWAEAANDMLAKTHSSHAPWTVVAATDFRFLRHTVFATLVARMEDALARRHGVPSAASLRQRAKAAHERAQATAREAGLPLDEA